MVLLLVPSIFDKNMIHVVAVGAIVFEYNVIHADAGGVSDSLIKYDKRRGCYDLRFLIE